MMALLGDDVRRGHLLSVLTVACAAVHCGPSANLQVFSTPEVFYLCVSFHKVIHQCQCLYVIVLC